MIAKSLTVVALLTLTVAPAWVLELRCRAL
jgi:hypothetical protein